MNSITLDNLNIDNIYTVHNERQLDFKEDPLVLSVSLKELMQKNPNSFYSLDDPRVLENISNDTVIQAEQIRKYYSKKFFWSNLSGGQPLSGFRSRLCYLLENRIRSCKEKDAGIYYKLPYFYDEDMNYDEFKRQYNTTDIPRITYGGPAKVKSQLTLKYVKTTSSRQQKRNINRFWFTDDAYLYSIEVTSDNPLLEMFTQLVTEKVAVTFDTNYNVDRIDQMYFYKLYNFTLTKETHA